MIQVDDLVDNTIKQFTQTFSEFVIRVSNSVDLAQKKSQSASDPKKDSVCKQITSTWCIFLQNSILYIDLPLLAAKIVVYHFF